ncbi:MAG: hypothetical protein CMH54_02275 [Myxococcales bacterium]|nr:hypothetical protein [Myxococcales bacterium]
MSVRRKRNARQPGQRLKYLEDEFYCRARRRRLSLGKCLNDYCNANAFEDRKSACWRCPQGQNNRSDYSREFPSF